MRYTQPVTIRCDARIAGFVRAELPRIRKAIQKVLDTKPHPVAAQVFPDFFGPESSLRVFYADGVCVAEVVSPLPRVADTEEVNIPLICSRPPEGLYVVRALGPEFAPLEAFELPELQLRAMAVVDGEPVGATGLSTFSDAFHAAAVLAPLAQEILWDYNTRIALGEEVDTQIGVLLRGMASTDDSAVRLAVPYDSDVLLLKFDHTSVGGWRCVRVPFVKCASRVVTLSDYSPTFSDLGRRPDYSDIGNWEELSTSVASTAFTAYEALRRYMLYFRGTGGRALMSVTTHPELPLVAYNLVYNIFDQATYQQYAGVLQAVFEVQLDQNNVAHILLKEPYKNIEFTRLNKSLGTVLKPNPPGTVRISVPSFSARVPFTEQADTLPYVAVPSASGFDWVSIGYEELSSDPSFVPMPPATFADVGLSENPGVTFNVDFYILEDSVMRRASGEFNNFTFARLEAPGTSDYLASLATYRDYYGRYALQLPDGRSFTYEHVVDSASLPAWTTAPEVAFPPQGISATCTAVSDVNPPLTQITVDTAASLPSPCPTGVSPDNAEQFLCRMVQEYGPVAATLNPPQPWEGKSVSSPLKTGPWGDPPPDSPYGVKTLWYETYTTRYIGEITDPAAVAVLTHPTPTSGSEVHLIRGFSVSATTERDADPRPPLTEPSGTFLRATQDMIGLWNPQAFGSETVWGYTPGANWDYIVQQASYAYTFTAKYGPGGQEAQLIMPYWGRVEVFPADPKAASAVAAHLYTGAAYSVFGAPYVATGAPQSLTVTPAYTLFTSSVAPSLQVDLQNPEIDRVWYMPKDPR